MNRVRKYRAKIINRYGKEALEEFDEQYANHLKDFYINGGNNCDKLSEAIAKKGTLEDFFSKGMEEFFNFKGVIGLSEKLIQFNREREQNNFSVNGKSNITTITPGYKKKHIFSFGKKHKCDDIEKIEIATEEMKIVFEKKFVITAAKKN